MKAGDLDPIRTLVNTRMARAFEDRGESLDAHELQRLLEPDWDFVPDDVQLVTMATDVRAKTAAGSKRCGSAGAQTTKPGCLITL